MCVWCVCVCVCGVCVWCVCVCVRSHSYLLPQSRSGQRVAKCTCTQPGDRDNQCACYMHSCENCMITMVYFMLVVTEVLVNIRGITFLQWCVWHSTHCHINYTCYSLCLTSPVCAPTIHPQIGRVSICCFPYPYPIVSPTYLSPYLIPYT